MGKKITNPKLMKPLIGKGESMLSVFNKFANQVTESRKKKIQKVGDIKQRLMQSKKSNKMLKVSKRTSKFALLQDEEGGMRGLTHKGKSINELKQFNDMNFGDDMEDDQFLKAHQNLNFTGFDQQQEVQKQRDTDRPKSKTQIYKEIIEKSKLHKHLRQEVYQQNFQKAVQLDNEFPDFVSKLKLRNRDSNVKDKIVNSDHDFEKMANMLREDERVVSNKVIEKTEKYTQNMKRKKNEQLNSLMKDSSDEEGDIRGWIKSVKDKNQEEEFNDQEEDQIDDVQLSSGDQEQEEQQEQDLQESENQDADENSQEEDQDENQDSNSEQVSEEQIQQPVKNNKKIPQGALQTQKGNGKKQVINQKNKMTKRK